MTFDFYTEVLHDGDGHVHVGFGVEVGGEFNFDGRFVHKVQPLIGQIKIEMKYPLQFLFFRLANLIAYIFTGGQLFVSFQFCTLLS